MGIFSVTRYVFCVYCYDVQIVWRISMCHKPYWVLANVNRVMCVCWGSLWCSWLRLQATRWKDTGLIPDGIIGIILLTQSFQPHYGQESTVLISGSTNHPENLRSCPDLYRDCNKNKICLLNFTSHRVSPQPGYSP